MATMRVLGLTINEVGRTVFDEVCMVSVISLLLGCFFGRLLNNYIIDIISREDLTFRPFIQVSSYLYTSSIMGIFISIILFISYLRIRQIDMVEALKEE